MEEIIRNLFAALTDLRKTYKEVKEINKKNSTLDTVSDELEDYVSAGLHIKAAYDILRKRNDVNAGEAIAAEEEAMKEFVNCQSISFFDEDDCFRVDADGEPTGATEIPDDFYGSNAPDDEEDISSDVEAAIASGEINLMQNEEPDLPY